MLPVPHVCPSRRTPYLAIAHTSTAAVLALFIANVQPAAAQLKLPNLFPFVNEHGIAQTFNAKGDGRIDLSGAFFQELGTNGRSCSSCHLPDQGWTVSA